MLTLNDFKASTLGGVIDEVLARADVLRAMEALSRDGRPAVQALDEALPAEVRLDRNEKQHAGRMIRDRLGESGWRVATRRPFRGGRFFSSGAVYRQAALKPPTPPAASTGDESWESRVAAAQEAVRRFSKNDYSVDDFIADKRREATRELRRRP